MAFPEDILKLSELIADKIVGALFATGEGDVSRIEITPSGGGGRVAFFGGLGVDEVPSVIEFDATWAGRPAVRIVGGQDPSTGYTNAPGISLLTGDGGATNISRIDLGADRVKVAGDIFQIAAVVSMLMGKDIRGIDFGLFVGVTNASSDVGVTYTNMGGPASATAAAVLCMSTGTHHQLNVLSPTFALGFDVRVRSAAGALVGAGEPVSFYYLAIKV